MANTKISELTAAGALAGTEQIPVVQSGTTKRTTASAVAALAGSSVHTAFVVGSGSGDYSTTSLTFVDLDSTNFSITIAAAVGDRLQMCFDGMVNHSVSDASSYVKFGFSVAGTDVGPTNGAKEVSCANNGVLYPVSAVWWHTVVSGNISGGNVVIKARYTGTTGSGACTKTVKNASTEKPVFSVTNWGA